jgi:hypothetical protein
MVVGHVSLRWSFGIFLRAIPGVPALEKQRFHTRIFVTTRWDFVEGWIRRPWISK